MDKYKINITYGNLDLEELIIKVLQKEIQNVK